MNIYMKNKQKKPKYSSLVKDGETIWEMIYDQENQDTFFVGMNDGKLIYHQLIDSGGQQILPYPIENSLVKNKVILFPSKAEEYGSEEDLLQAIRKFIHKYLEVSEFFEQITPFYVLLTWVYDNFKELPYLRAIGDYGCGKSRFLKAIGSICYKPAFTAGATNPAPLFRIIDQFKGTLVIDEADMRFSDTNSEVVKILNNGFQAGMPVLRCANSENSHEVECYDVFCPKIVATRERYEDKALESRFLVEHMDGRLTRKDVPINLTDEFDQEALELRNKCLMWRLRNYGKKKLDVGGEDWGIQPRLNQVIAPLKAVIESETVKQELMAFIKKYDAELTIDRGLSYEAPILMAIIGLVSENKAEITMDDISKRYNIGLVRGEKELSPRRVGSIVREKFGFTTDRKNVGYVLDRQNYKNKIERLCKKYGVPSELVNLVNVVDEDRDSFVKEVESLMHEPVLPNF